MRLLYSAPVALLWALSGCAATAPEAASRLQPIVGGTAVGSCAWPSAVLLTNSRCSGTLVHPRVVTTAAHCVAGAASTTVAFGENDTALVRSVHATCTAHPSYTPNGYLHDIGVCLLDEAVAEVPATPILMGCELDLALAPGAAATLVGFGNTSAAGEGFGTKRQVAVTINTVDRQSSEVNVGDAAMGACHGDSGGPAYVQAGDGSWRVFGATSRGAGADCASGTLYTLLTDYLPWIEKTSGVDVTPCLGADGSFQPGAACGHFPLDPGAGGGSWAAGCADATHFSGALDRCGDSSDGGSGVHGHPGVDLAAASDLEGDPAHDENDGPASDGGDQEVTRHVPRIPQIGACSLSAPPNGAAPTSSTAAAPLLLIILGAGLVRRRGQIG